MHKRNACAKVAAAILSVTMVMSSLPASVLAEDVTAAEDTAVMQEAETAVVEETAAEEAVAEETAAEETAVEPAAEAEAAAEEAVDVAAEEAVAETEMTDVVPVEESAEEEEIILEASEDAEMLEVAETEESTEESESETEEVTWPRYGTMTMSYNEFYSGLVSDATTVDAVSSATTKKTSMFTNADVENITDSGYQIEGVKNVPVIVYENASDELKARVTFDDSVDVSTVTQYRTVDENGIGALTMDVKATVTDASAVLNTSSNWGDYCIEITESSTSYLRNGRTGEWPVAANIMGVILTTSDGYQVGLTHMDNIWVQTYEVAFSVSGNANSTELAKLVGQTITSVTYIVPEGTYVYNFSGIYVKPSYEDAASVKGSFSEDGTTFSLTAALPEALANPTISVSYRSGHSSVSLLDATAVTEGQTSFTLTTAVPDDTTPTARISSDNYADIAVSYPTEELTALIAEGTALLDLDANYDYTALNEKLTAAQTMLDAQAAGAVEMMAELQELIDAASVRYGTMTMSYSEFYSGMASAAVDAVSSATTKKNTMFDNADTTDVTDSGYQINGVKNIPVQVMPSASDDLKARVTYTEDAEVPTQYYTLDANGIGAWTQNLAATVTDASAALSTSSRYGDYEIDVTENSTAYLRNDRTNDRPVNSGIVGIVLETATGDTYGLGHMQNIWVQPYKLAFSVDGVYAGLVGQTVTKITYLMPTASYVYDLGDGVYIKPAYSGTAISGSFSADGTTFTLDAAVDTASLTNAQISISYRSGRQSVSLLDATTVGTSTSFTLTTALPDQTVPTITISSDSCADVTVSYPMFDWQKTQLEEQIATGANAIAYGGADEVLSAHMEEAQALLANASATAAEASELYSELSGYVTSALAKVSADTLELSTVTLAESSYSYDGTAKNPAVASVQSKDGTVVDAANYTVTYSDGCTELGTYQVTVTGKNGFTGSASASFEIQAASIANATITLSKTSYTYNGKKKKPAVTVTLNGTELSADNYTVSYKNNKKVGTATVTVTGAGSNYTGEQTVQFTINPKKTSIKTKTAKKKAISLTWKKIKNISGYQIQYSTSKKFTKKTTKTVSKSKTSYQIKNLKSKKTYYVRIRTYKKVNGKKYYSSWSKVIKVKTK